MKLHRILKQRSSNGARRYVTDVDGRDEKRSALHCALAGEVGRSASRDAKVRAAIQHVTFVSSAVLDNCPLTADDSWCEKFLACIVLCIATRPDEFDVNKMREQRNSPEKVKLQKQATCSRTAVSELVRRTKRNHPE